MATFKYEVMSGQRKQDGTWNVKIRFTHNRKVKRISTPWYVTKEQMTKGFKIKDQRILAVLDDAVRTYRERFTALGIAAKGMDIELVARAILTEDNRAGIKFYPWAEQFVKSKKSPGVYRNALNSFMKFVGVKNILFQDITSSTIKGWMETMPAKTAKNLVPRLRHIYDSGKLEFNDEDVGRILIPNNPFQKIELPKVDEPRKRAVSADIIRMVALIPDNGRLNSLRNMTRDMYLLSFCMIGLNAADIYDMSCKPDGYLSYERKKTRDNRGDRAFIKVHINEYAEPIVKKYRGVHKTFNVERRYSDSLVFDNSLKEGMKQVQKAVLSIYRKLHQNDQRNDADVLHELNIKPFNFYSARHTWATIARNDIGEDKWTVHEALNHVDSETRIDDVYIRKDFSRINEANDKVLEYVFGPIIRKTDEIIGFLECATYICMAIKKE